MNYSRGVSGTILAGFKIYICPEQNMMMIMMNGDGDKQVDEDVDQRALGQKFILAWQPVQNIMLIMLKKI